MTVTDYPDYATSQDHANKIASTGAPLLSLKTLIAENQLGLAIPGTTQAQIVTSASLKQISYELLLIIETTAGTATPLSVFIQWSDSVTGQVTDFQTWTMFAGTSAAPHNVRITGPSNADTLNVFVKNGANAITLFYTVLQSSRVYSRHLGHTVTNAFAQPVFPGFTYASGDMASGIIMAESDNIAASSNVQRLLPLYYGTARAWGRASDGTGSNSEWRITYLANTVPVGDSFPYLIVGNAGFSPSGQGSMEIENVAMSRCQHGITMLNHNTATANSMQMHLIAQEMTT